MNQGQTTFFSQVERAADARLVLAEKRGLSLIF